MKRTVEDSEFGRIEVPPPPSRDEFEKVARKALAALEKRRVWPAGSVSRCPQCGKRAFVGRDDLSCEIARPGGIVIFKNLRGAKCEACKAQSLEPADLVRVEQDMGVGTLSDYEARVSSIGSGTLGTYWPKDVVRNLALEPGKKVYIQILDRETALVKFAAGPALPRGQPSRKARKKASKAVEASSRR